MDNPTRSQRSRSAALQAALVIVARDGPGRLTLDAIAREGGLSKGGLMHQFPTKTALLKALLDYQVEHFQQVRRNYLAAAGAIPEVNLLSQIATSREAATKPDSVAVAILAVISEDPSQLAEIRKVDAENLALVKAEAADPDLAALRWAAARGLAITAILGMCPLSAREREHLFDRLLDSEAWPADGKSSERQRPETAPKRSLSRAIPARRSRER